MALVALYALALLWARASGAMFQTDECFHAYLSRWIAEHGALPREITGLYSGFAYFYPPLFHIVGALSVAIAGVGSLPYVNVVLIGLLYAILIAAPFAGVPRAPRRWTVLLLAANLAIVMYVQRFYAETLATLLAVLVVLLLLQLRARGRVRDGVALGVAAGLAIVEKQPFVLFPALFGLLAVVYALRRERGLATALAIALGVSVLVSAPFFLRNELLYGSPFYPAPASEAARALDDMNTHMFSGPASAFFRSALQAAGPLIPWLALAALAVALWRGPRDLTAGVLALCLGFVAVAPLVHRFQARHLNPFLAVIALLSCLLLHEALRSRRAICTIAEWALAVWAAVAVARQPDFRPQLNAAPVLLEGYRAVGEHVPEGSTVLSLWTYDTFYYSGRAATWPIPWSRSADQLVLFQTTDPERFLATLRSQGIDYLLVPIGRPPERFNGGNYPASFVECVSRLLDSGRLRVVWRSASLGLVTRTP